MQAKTFVVLTTGRDVGSWPVAEMTAAHVAAGFWGAAVAEGGAATIDGRHALACVRNRSKFRRGGHKAQWLSLTDVVEKVFE